MRLDGFTRVSIDNGSSFSYGDIIQHLDGIASCSAIHAERNFYFSEVIIQQENPITPVSEDTQEDFSSLAWC